MPFKYRFFFLLAFLAVFTKVQYFDDQHKLKGGFTLLENKLVVGSARGEPAKTPSLRIVLTMACSCRYFRWVKLRCIIKISGFQNCLRWQTSLSTCFRPSPVLAASSLKYHKLFQKCQAHSKRLRIPSPNAAIRAGRVHQISQLSVVSGRAPFCGQRDVCGQWSVFNGRSSAVLNEAPA